MKKIILTILFVAIAAVLVNDVGRYAKAQYDLDRIALETVEALSDQGARSRDQNAKDAAQRAASRGAVVYAYDQDDERTYAWLQMPVEGTWVMGPTLSLLAGESLETPYLIQIEKSATFQ